MEDFSPTRSKVQLFEPLSGKNSKRLAAADDRLNKMNDSPIKRREPEQEDYMTNFLAEFLIKTEDQINQEQQQEKMLQRLNAINQKHPHAPAILPLGIGVSPKRQLPPKSQAKRVKVDDKRV